MSEADPNHLPEIIAESRATRTARDLADLSMAAEPGAWLGAEAELLVRLGVSRPTLRQAAKMVEADKLISIRRGQGGGFFATRPTALDAIRAPARYLALNGATLDDMVRASRAISEEAAGAAALSTNAGLKQQLKQFADSLAYVDASTETPTSWIRRESELARLMAKLSGNPVIELFMEIGYNFGHWERGHRLYQTAGERALALKTVRKLVQAVLEGDADVARIMTRRRSQMIVARLAGQPVADND